MSLTVLFDLDGTLLGNDVRTFLPAYIRLLSQQLTGWPAEEVVKHLLEATGHMVSKTSPIETLEQTFDRHFYPALGTTRQALQPVIDHFYSQVYPSLRTLTSPQNGAMDVVNLLLEQGHQVVVATNPLFPRTAIEQRLEWAGLPVNRTPFSLVTNFSDFHFSKPHPAFYAEILAQLGWPDQAAVMVGDSLSDDILPASALGMPAYWISPESQMPAGLHALSRAGGFEGVLDWLQTVEQAQPAPGEVAALVPAALLRSTSAALECLMRDQSKAVWKARPAKGEWGPTEIMCHLRDVEREVNIPRLRQLLAEDNPFLAGIDTDQWARERRYCRQDGARALAEFTVTRAELLHLLDGLTAQQWQRSARHAVFGPTHLAELISFICQHDKNHLRQIRQALHI